MDQVKKSHKEHNTTPSHQLEHSHDHDHKNENHDHKDGQEHSHPHEHPPKENSEHKHTENVKTELKQEIKEDKKAEKKEDKKAKVIITKKKEAIARGLNMHVSKRQCMYISSFIKNKTIDKAIQDLEMVIKFKKAVPFKGEIPHKKGMMSGRYPVKAAALFITLLKGLKGNILINGLEPEQTRIAIASANWASRPLRREGKKAKRTNVTLIAREVVK